MTSPANPKMGLRMTTLHEEQVPLPRKHSLELITDEHGEEDKYDNNEDSKSGCMVCCYYLIELKCI